MTFNQIAILAVLAASMAMFIRGRWRHDMVAMGALLTCVALDLVPDKQAFAGFGHPAVVTVACILIMSRGLQFSGALEILVQRMLPSSAGPLLSILAIMSLAALLSGFMNNVGALALLMPIALQMSARQDIPPGRILMPLAFGSILGGMTTLIGTPPNLIVSEFRADFGRGQFGIFDFTPVGLAVALSGVAFIGLIGWRLVPIRNTEAAGGFESGNYLSEVRIVEGSKADNKTLREVERLLEEADAQVVGIIRREVHIIAPNPRRILRDGDILVIEVEPQSLNSVLSSLGLKLEEEEPIEPEKQTPTGSDADAVPMANLDAPPEDDAANSTSAKNTIRSNEIVIQELVASPGASLIDRTASDIELRSRYGINLLAISRQGRRTIKRLRTTRIQAGDLLLMQGTPESLSGFAGEFGCLPLAPRDIRVPKRGQALAASSIMALSVGLAALGILPAAISFAAGALAFLVFGIVPIRSSYSAIDWPVIVLLGAMLPVAGALGSTGAAEWVARLLLDSLAQGHAIAALTVILLITMFLSDVMNNAATAAVMCPVAISVSEQLRVNPDAFLMAVAVGASCAFLTPIGHQNSTLILGPGGFSFGDYWRLGLPLEIIVALVAIPMILWVWPLP
ncbi:MAG: SLC13 family permease [Gammaproteobacteria bacterium]